MDRKEIVMVGKFIFWINVSGITTILLLIFILIHQSENIDRGFWIMMMFFAIGAITGLAIKKWEAKLWVLAEQSEQRQKQAKSLLESKFYFGLGIATTGYLAILTLSSPQIRSEPICIIISIGLIIFTLDEMFRDVKEWRRKAKAGSGPLDDERLRSIARQAMVSAFYVTLAAMFAFYVLASVFAAKGVSITAENVLGLLLGVALFSAYFFYRHYARKGVPEPRTGADSI